MDPSSGSQFTLLLLPNYILSGGMFVLVAWLPRTFCKSCDIEEELNDDHENYIDKFFDEARGPKFK